MSDIIVTLSKTFRWEGAPSKLALQAWLAEGDAPGTETSGVEYAFSCGFIRPDIAPGERVYVCHHGSLIGYASLIRVERTDGCWQLIRGGGAVAVTIPEDIKGFRGWRRRWWDRSLECQIDLDAFAMRLREKGGRR